MTMHNQTMKLMIRSKTPMSASGFASWGRARIHINKSKYVFKPFASSKERYPSGVPVHFLATDKALAEWLIDTYNVTDGMTYTIQGFVGRKTRTHVGWSKTLAEITIHNAELKQYTVGRTGILQRYWFRREQKKSEIK